MKRDMDLVRRILLDIEDGVRSFDADFLSAHDDYTAENARDLRQHLKIMADYGLIEIAIITNKSIKVQGLTWEGHDFVDTVRDPDTWKRTKSAAATVGGVGFKAIVEIGKAIAKQKLQELGLPLP